MATIPIDAGTEILYPHQADRKTNHILHRTDDNRWQGGIKNSSLQERKTIKLSFRIKRAGDSYKTFIQFIHDNFNTTATLTKLGTDFFGDGNTSNTVKILGYDKPIRELVGWYRIDVMFEQV